MSYNLKNYIYISNDKQLINCNISYVNITDNYASGIIIYSDWFQYTLNLNDVLDITQQQVLQKYNINIVCSINSNPINSIIQFINNNQLISSSDILDIATLANIFNVPISKIIKKIHIYGLEFKIINIIIKNNTELQLYVE